MFIVIAPMMAAIVLTILYKDSPHYFIDWFIYAYALYGTLKMIFAIKNLVKKDKTDRPLGTHHPKHRDIFIQSIMDMSKGLLHLTVKNKMSMY